MSCLFPLFYFSSRQWQGFALNLLTRIEFCHTCCSLPQVQRNCGWLGLMAHESERLGSGPGKATHHAIQQSTGGHGVQEELCSGSGGGRQGGGGGRVGHQRHLGVSVFWRVSDFDCFLEKHLTISWYFEIYDLAVHRHGKAGAILTNLPQFTSIVLQNGTCELIYLD